MLAIARALMGRPKLLLLDEPSLGLAPLIVKQIFEAIRALNSKHGLTVFLVEQNAYHALKLAHRGYVMVNGRITHERHRRANCWAAGGAGGLSRGRPAQGAARSAAMTWLSDDSLWVFLVLTVIIGGGAAFLAGRAGAIWKPFWRVFFYMVLLAAAVRFFHYALFDGELLSLYYYLVTYAILLGAALLGFRIMRTTQMVTQYRWLYERTSPLTWRDRALEANPARLRLLRMP